jgi:hypothetical protein
VFFLLRLSRPGLAMVTFPNPPFPITVSLLSFLRTICAVIVVGGDDLLVSFWDYPGVLLPIWMCMD